MSHTVKGTYILKTYVTEILQALRDGGSVTVPTQEHVDAIIEMLDYGEHVYVQEADDGLKVKLR